MQPAQLQGQEEHQDVASIAASITLTAEEEATLTIFNAAAFDIMRDEARRHGSTVPTWLCLIESQRNEARESLRFRLQFDVGPLGLSMADAEKYVESLLTPEQKQGALKRWRDVELRFKRLRAEGNPHAFFATSPEDATPEAVPRSAQEKPKTVRRPERARRRRAQTRRKCPRCSRLVSWVRASFHAHRCVGVQRGSAS